ncbi:NAD(P)-binding protein [Wolfiporia cocos MD-104 SS10]|uniref:NAD(P)-binding protein n=1 Tax=Wolfiporia cocos (strain MD-104) TaxID=742152 RepID=A0A2H3JRD4_WOLCO|nr:NAD(P)-binding protein [Wolfiporia cocos MD-104 SS10]
MAFLHELWYSMLIMWRVFFPWGNFTVDQIPDLTGQVMIVTGGNVGIGRETIKALLQHNAKVYMASRSKEKADEAIKHLKEETGKAAIFLELDLSDLSSVRRAAKEFLSKESELHALFNNAGVMVPPIEMVTKDGYDMQFGTNVVGHHLFTQLLVPALVAGKRASPDHHARIITTSSAAAMSGFINWDTLKDGPVRRARSTRAMYAQSKLANAIVARQLAKRYADQGIISMSVDPGSIRTDLQRHAKEEFSTGIKAILLEIVFWALLRPTPFGALTQLWAGTMPEAIHHNGKYLIPTARVGTCRPEAYDDELGARLWDWLEHEVQEKP